MYLILKLVSQSPFLKPLGVWVTSSWFLPTLRNLELIYTDATWALRHLKSLAIQLFVQKFVQADKKENIKGSHYGPIVRGIYLKKSFHLEYRESFILHNQ